MFKRKLLVIGLASLLGACGFHLRGVGHESFALSELNLTARNSYGPTVKDLRALLENSSVKISPQAAYTLDLSNEQENQRTLSYTTNTRSAEYELTNSVDYQVLSRDKLVLLTDRVEVQKSYVHDGNNLIGSDQEAAQLRAENRRELIQQLAMRLQMLTPARLADLESSAKARAKAEAEAAAAAAKARADQPQPEGISLPFPKP